MKSTIISSVRLLDSGHEFQTATKFSVSKKLLMLAMLILLATAKVNARTTFVKSSKTKEVKMGKNKKANKKIEKSKLPKVVTTTFITEFPVLTIESWFTYPKFDFESDWYRRET
ncbi:hypothetical protein [Flavobacterium cellulosilyticum]|uniref:Uncharacterized protein n=1 Tax=Flavobacterium cellulosilyticum TaxID=2541731 RepID=A0A4R5C3K1_9FLAO|nr:hypothetical protein [Flavobacterium cellulosilyticum]TDD94178.1 hypothetical protein E0F76_17195 [Flavobacterium cellulosilyticum]